MALPSQARVVIIGGGIAGCSVAYHLAKLGWKDVVLLERKKLTSGTTWHATGLVQPGSLSIATNKERWEEFQRGAAMLRGFDVIAEQIGPQDVKKKWPLLNVDDVIGAIYYPKDGKCNPADVTMALARGARTGGAKIFEDTKVTRVLTKDGRVTGVETDQGVIACEYEIGRA